MFDLYKSLQLRLCKKLLLLKKKIYSNNKRKFQL